MRQAGPQLAMEDWKLEMKSSDSELRRGSVAESAHTQRGYTAPRKFDGHSSRARSSGNTGLESSVAGRSVNVIAARAARPAISPL
jgi:hypothetical protein